MFRHLAFGSEERRREADPWNQSYPAIVAEWQEAEQRIARRIYLKRSALPLLEFPKRSRFANTNPASGDIGLARLDFGFELVCHFEPILDQVLEPVAQTLLLFGTEAQDGLLNVDYGTHGNRIFVRKWRSSASVVS